MLEHPQVKYYKGTSGNSGKLHLLRYSDLIKSTEIERHFRPSDVPSGR